MIVVKLNNKKAAEYVLKFNIDSSDKEEDKTKKTNQTNVLTQWENFIFNRILLLPMTTKTQKNVLKKSKTVLRSHTYAINMFACLLYTLFTFGNILTSILFRVKFFGWLLMTDIAGT